MLLHLKVTVISSVQRHSLLTMVYVMKVLSPSFFQFHLSSTHATSTNFALDTNHLAVCYCHTCPLLCVPKPIQLMEMTA